MNEKSTELDKNAYYTVEGYGGIAWYTLGYHVEEIWDSNWDEVEEVVDTAKAVMVMVGDDRKFVFDIEELTELDEDEFCHTCGQIGCTADG